MKTTEAGVWRRTSPLAILYFIGKVVRLVVQNGWQALAPLAGLAVLGDFSIAQLAVIGGGSAFLLIAIGSFLSYWNYRFQLNDDSILIRQGVVKKSQLDIKFDRIQGINTRQDIVFRLFGLVTVSFDTAGSQGDEGSLPAVSREFANVLRTRLDRTPARDGADEPGLVTPVQSVEPLLRLAWRDIVRIGLADRRVYFVLAALGPLYERIGENLYEIAGRQIEAFAIENLGTSLSAGIAAVGLLMVAVVLVLSLISVMIAFLRYHDFKLFLENKTLRSEGGLLTRHEVSMELGKIQTLRLQQGLILRWLKRYELTARQARAGQRNDRDKHFTIPIVDAKQANALRREFLGDEGRGLIQLPGSTRFRAISGWSMRTPLLVNVLAPLLFSGTVYVLGNNPAVFFVCLWIPISVMAIVMNWRHAGYHVNNVGLVRRSGIIGYRTVALLFRKVQRVTITRSVLQRRKGLATLRVYMASGPVKIPFIAHAEAKQLRDYIIYNVERSTKSWH